MPYLDRHKLPEVHDVHDADRRYRSTLYEALLLGPMFREPAERYPLDALETPLLA